MSPKRLETLLKFIIGITFFVPLIVVPSSYIFPFIVPKIVWFRSLTLLMLGAYILLLISNWKEYRPRFTFVNMAVLLFAFSFAISTFTGVDWYRSFWDNHERMLGLFTILHFIIYYFVITSVIKEKKDWLWLLRTFLFAGFLVMFIGLLQKANPELLLNRGSDRVSATLGNSIYFSGYGLFLFFIGLYLFLQNKQWNFWKYFSLAGGLLGFWGIFGGGTRGTLLGLLVGLFILAVGYLITLKDYKKIRIGIVSGLGFLILIGGILFVYRQTNFVKNIPAVGRLVNTTIDLYNPRIMAWGIAWEAFLEKPVFGWGPNNYYYAFNKYYRPEFLRFGWNETWFDNAHNILMNTLSVQGGFGLVTYLSLFGSAIFVLWRGYKRNLLEVNFVVIASAFLLAHFTHNVTVFENPTSYLYFFFFLAFVNQLAGNSSQSTEKSKKANSVSVGPLVIVGLLVLLTIYATDINTAKANKLSLKAIQALYTNPAKAIDIFQEALKIPSPHIDDIRNDFSRNMTQGISNVMDKDLGLATKMFNACYPELDKNIQLHPMDIRIHIQQSELAVLGYKLTKNSKLVFDSEKLLEQALAFSPKRQQVQYNLSSLKLSLGKNAEAIKLLQDSIDNDAQISGGWWRLALTYQQIGKEKEAKNLITEALSKGVVFDEQGKQVVDTVMATTIKK